MKNKLNRSYTGIFKVCRGWEMEICINYHHLGDENRQCQLWNGTYFFSLDEIVCGFIKDYKMAGIYRDRTFNNVKVNTGFGIPIVDTSLPVVSTNPQARNTLEKGKLAADRTDCCLYLTDGLAWNFVGGCESNNARVRLEVSIIGATNFQDIVFDTIESDPSGIYNDTTGEFTIPRTGTYALDGTICATNFASIPVTVYGIVIAVNATNESKSSHRVNSAPSFESESIHREIALTAGDVVTFRLAAFGGNSCNVLGTDISGISGTSWASIRRVA